MGAGRGGGERVPGMTDPASSNSVAYKQARETLDGAAAQQKTNASLFFLRAALSRGAAAHAIGVARGNVVLGIVSVLLASGGAVGGNARCGSSLAPETKPCARNAKNTGRGCSPLRCRCGAARATLRAPGAGMTTRATPYAPEGFADAPRARERTSRKGTSFARFRLFRCCHSARAGRVANFGAASGGLLHYSTV